MERIGLVLSCVMCSTSAANHSINKVMLVWVNKMMYSEHINLNIKSFVCVSVL